MATTDEHGDTPPHGSEIGTSGFTEDAAEVDASGVVAELKAQIEQAREQQLRAYAELENVRKRTAREVEQAHKFAVERFAAELVGVKDSLEMAVAAAGQRETGPDDGLNNGVIAGVDATLKLLTRAFEKAGLTEVVPVGQPFNPELHEAMATQPSAEHAPDTVTQVVQKGYVLNGRLIRPARVIVARAP